MVVVLQLDDEAGVDAGSLIRPELQGGSHVYHNRLGLQPWLPSPNATLSGHGKADAPKPDRARHMLADLLVCYPVCMSLVSNLDLNDLHWLSRSSHQIRERLLEFRHQILPRTLHCVHEEANENKVRTGRWTVPCARDLVSPCRRCAAISCRNCTIKPPSNRELPRRFRRLCRKCQKADLEQVTTLPSPTRSQGPMSADVGREPCICSSEGVYVCKDCPAKSADDINYIRVWTWRTRYHSLGFGLGTGIGEGNEGVKCGRGEHCLAARDIIVDMDCAEVGKTTAIVDDHGNEVLDLHDLNAALEPQDGEGSREDSAGYYRQEIEGIGKNIIKKKLKKRVRVGATVAEYEDERHSGQHLERERTHDVRSWCAWCDRVILSAQDNERACTSERA